MNKIEFKDVSFSYTHGSERNILEDLTTSFDSSKITVLTGPSGCGKSTLLYLASGIFSRAGDMMLIGNIVVNGQEIGELTPEKRCKMAGIMFQNPELQFCMDTVENEILFCLGNIQTPREEMQEYLNHALEFCGIAHLKDRKLQSLSGGEKQKAMLACLAALRPSWLLLDEPFANIDESAAFDLVQKIKKLHENGVGVLVVDHRLDYWLPVADEIRLMDEEKGIDHTSYKPSDLSPEMMMQIGILPADRYYRYPSKIDHKETWETVLELNRLTVIRGGIPVLNQTCAQFERQKVYAIIGASGSGKSTLFGVLQGLYSFEGDILLEGKRIQKPRNIKAGSIGFVTQSPQDQFVADTVRSEIEVSAGYLRGKEKGVKHRVESILRGINLWGYRNFSPYMLSQGQQRRLGLAALLAYDCKALICDEPTYAQDWKNTTAIMDSLIRKTKENGMTLIFSTHDSKLAASYADVILELKEGKLHECSKSCL